MHMVRYTGCTFVICFFLLLRLSIFERLHQIKAQSLKADTFIDVV
jgi:hypothetical protein